MRKILTALFLMLGLSFAWAEKPWLSIPESAAMPEAVESGMAEVNNIKMYYATYGNSDKTPILLVHGGLAYGDIWGSQVVDLAKDHRVIVADTRGHGRSTNDGSEYSIELLAKDYVALLDHLKVDKVHLVGWSDGANIGYEIAKSAPHKLASLFAHAGNVTLKGVNPAVEKDKVFGEYIGKMAAMYGKVSPTPDQFDAFVGGISKMWFADKANGLEEVKKIKAPTVVVQSQYDEAILPEHAKAIADNIEGATLLTLEDVSHFAMLQNPASYNAAIREFIAKH